MQDIADHDFQASTWSGNSKSVSSPVELYCILFDDFLFEEFIESKDASLNSKQKNLAEALVKSMEQCSDLVDQGDHIALLDDPRWIAVRMAARQFLESFRN